MTDRPHAVEDNAASPGEALIVTVLDVCAGITMYADDDEDAGKLHRMAHHWRKQLLEAIATPAPAKAEAVVTDAEHQRELLGQAIVDAAHKAGIISVNAQVAGPMLLMLCDDLATAALSAPAREGWQPIETAPKDGTMVAVKFPSGHTAQATWRTTYGGEWHFDALTHLPWADSPTHWRDAAMAATPEKANG